MDSDFWIKKWQQGDTRFHQAKFHPALEKYSQRFSAGKILVPLCGKSLDMLYLASQGHLVIGVELSIIACRDFFKENEISFTEKAVEDFTVFESDKVTLWCGDFFKLPEHVWHEVSGIYDRAALVALPEEMRRRYAAEIVKHRKDSFGILLISFEYPKDTIEGPPFSVTEEEIKRIFGPLDVQKLQSETETKYTKDHPKLKSIDLTETVFWLV